MPWNGKLRQAIADKLKNGSLQTVAIALVAAMLGGPGGVVALRFTYPEVIRPDQFTGSDWKDKSDELRREFQGGVTALTATVNHIDKQMGILETRLASSEAIFMRHEELLERELSSIQVVVVDIDQQLRKITGNLSELPPPEWRKRIQRLEDTVYQIPNRSPP